MALSAHSEKSLGQKYLPSLEDQQEIIDLLRERRPITVMGIESSCDETGVGVVELSQASDGTAEVRVLANEIATSMYEHERFGGVVPEIASRAHLESMSQVMDRALNKVRETRPDFTKPDALATTIGPGLAGALMVGGSAAKGYAAAWEIPLYAVNHLGGHVAVDALSSPDSEDAQPRDLSHAIALLVSGGHTEILEVHGIGTPMRVLGSTYDDAAGEAYDKVARLMGLGYPGGPIIDRLAAQGDPSAIDFPRGLSKKSDPAYDFSFSGLKTAVARYIETAEKNGSTIPVEDLCASFQEAVADILTQKAVAACKDTGARVLLLGGGVSANHRLRELAQQRCDDAGIELHVPPLDLCTDNGVMIATLAAFLIDHGEKPSSLSVASDPSLDVSIPILH